MGWAERTGHQGPGMHITRRRLRSRILSMGAINADLNETFRIGKPPAPKTRVRGVVMRHKPSGHGHGKWQTVRSLIKYILKRRERNRVAAASRAQNR